MYKYAAVIFCIVCSLCAQSGRSQQMISHGPSKEIICYADFTNKGTLIRPANDQNGRKQSTANFEVEYIGFTEEAQTAFQAAIDIWAGLISSPVPIKIRASWEDLPIGVLGSARWGSLRGNFTEAQKLNTFYPVALAEKMAARNFNGDEPDIIAQFSRNQSWYFGTDQNPAFNEFDLVSVVLHEIGHGLGFTDSFNFDQDDGFSHGFLSNGQVIPMIYDTYVENATGEVIIDEFPSFEEELGIQLTSQGLFFNSPVATNENMAAPRIFAPNEWNNGSSIAHLDEETFPSGNENSLMTPQISFNEVMQHPGPIALNMLGDMGWEFLYITPDRPNSENPTATFYPVVAHVEGDNAVEVGSVQLHYSTDNFATETVVEMTPTGIPNEYSADIPSTSAPTVYTYYISANDIKGRTFRYPGLAPEFPAFFESANSDNEPPIIVHTTPERPVRSTDSETFLEATVADFLEISGARVDYSVNNGPMRSAPMTLVDDVDSIYRAVIDLSSETLAEGDRIVYTISATDASVNLNSITTDPFELAVIDVATEYLNDFNGLTDDFISSGEFTITTPPGFTNGAIHSEHPYQDGSGSNGESNYTMELKVPILLAESEAKILFDEIVLVEPGSDGTTFGESEFWDYVIVEGSKDRGTTWQPFEDGYDARADPEWLWLYNRDIEGDNSLSTADPALFKSREIDMLANGNFLSGEEVLIRFRLFADPAAHGWGWAIDNLFIQLSNSAPDILHDHVDLAFEDTLELEALISDNILVDSVAIMFRVNGDDQPHHAFDLATPLQQVNTTFTLDVSQVTPGDTVKYRYVAIDSEGNVSYLPGRDTFFEIFKLGSRPAVSVYSNNFDTPTNDFFGNFFSIEQPNGFGNPAIHSVHPYPLSFGLNDNSDFTYALIQPIKINETNPRLSFDEVVLVQPTSGGAFGSDTFNDFVVVEGSSDDGATWIPFEDGYDSQTANRSEWLSAYTSFIEGNERLAANHTINMVRSGDFAPGDEIYIRFRLHSDLTVNGWGWTIDNLQIQTDSILTALNPFDDISSILIYPNPVTSDRLVIEFNPESNPQGCSVSVIDLNGRFHLFERKASIMDNRITMDLTILNPGIYIIEIENDLGTHKKRIIKY